MDRQHLPEDLTFGADLHPLERVRTEVPKLAREWIATYRETARLLGERTAEMHLALASDRDDPTFAPEPYTDFYRLGLYHGILSDISRAVQVLRTSGRFEGVVDAEETIREKVRPFRERRLDCVRIRIHGHYELPQILFTGKDLVIVDFEGNPLRSLNDRAIKRSPLQDAISMLLSLREASLGASAGKVPGFIAQSEDAAITDLRERFWYRWVSASFLRGYLDKLQGTDLIPSDEEGLRTLFDALKIEVAMARILRIREGEDQALQAAVSLLL